VAVCWFNCPALNAHADIEEHIGIFGGVL